jgi:adenylate kinase
MAPITDTVVDDLKNTVSRLEQRIVELENRLSGHGGSAPSAQESVRMILMGPPGAGEFWTVALLSFRASC